MIGYLQAVLSQEHGIEHSAICYLGNHEHAVSHDSRGEIPDFWRDAHALLAKHVKATFKDDEPLWDNRQTNSVRPVEPEDTLGRIAYTAGNPVKHRLVKFARSYPGLRMVWPCKPRTFKRPRGFLNSKAKKPDGSLRWPDEATLEMHRPKGFDDLTDDQLAVKIAERCKAQEEEWRAEVTEPKGFLGRHNLLKQARTHRPKSKPDSAIIPRVACKDPTLRRRALAELKAWLADYKACLGRFRAGDFAVEFPFGTFKMKVACNVRVCSAPT